MIEVRSGRARLRGQAADNLAPLDLPGFIPASIRSIFCRGIVPYHGAALSRDAEETDKTDAMFKELIPENTHPPPGNR
ncbi:hypothetical protein NPS49_07130 [Pseudomonas putida]|uniref:hypothetical protein n=1 Tax=Pseudomonas TaxID=286 RepID=UPI000A55E5EA|nr:MULTISPECIES: hypothetical protein [Pseudomonas]EKT4448946.1 hypothetical protein [Pseudomonas putida]MDD2068095.1 hypothetical protein [Pseudomonas putida]HDS1740442.1 hypothetical protein [Pseudomonas putida]